ncbi:MAG: MoxR family ATPase, partial [Acidobacteriota bacterium]
AMQERQVTIGDTTYPLEPPFLVLATQNPIEQEGTYPLPEAQVDRFMLKLRITYPTKEEEKEILNRMSGSEIPAAQRVVGSRQILQANRIVQEVFVDERIKDYLLKLVFATRAPKEFGLDLTDLIQYGASPRASIYLLQAAKAHAFIRNRGYVIPEDIRAIGPDVLRHRILLTYEAEAEEVTSDGIIRQIFDAVEVP